MADQTTGSLPPVPTGIQKLLRLASVDDAFCEQLIQHRAAVAESAGVQLTRSEQAILSAIPADQLREMAQKMPLPAPPRREFLRRASAAALVLFGGAVVADAVDALVFEEHASRVMGCNPMAQEGGASPHLDDDTSDDDTGDDDDTADDDDSAADDDDTT
jgi:hypothetical protein